MADKPFVVPIAGDAGDALHQTYDIDSAEQAQWVLDHKDQVYAKLDPPWGGDRETFDWAADKVKQRFDSGEYQDGELARREQAQAQGILHAHIQRNNYLQPGPSGNTVGIVIPKTQINLTPPHTGPETEQESWFQQFIHSADQELDKLGAQAKAGAIQAAQYYKNNVSESLHGFAGDAMQTGGTIAVAGGATAAVGGAITATGVGAPVGAVTATAGGAVAAVGGGVAAVGAGSEGAATVLDKAADWIVEGKPPEVMKPALELGERLVTNLLLRKAQQAFAFAERAARSGSKPPPKGKEDKKPEDKKQEGGGDSGGSGGGYVLGREGPCQTGTYDELKGKCGKGMQAHHIIPDSLVRTGNRAQGQKDPSTRLLDSTFGGGPAICLQGNAGDEGSEHNTAHKADKEIKEAANRTDNGPAGTLPFSQAAEISMEKAIKARPDCAEQIRTEVQKRYPNHKSDNRPVNGAGRPTTGDAKAHLEEHSGANRNRTYRRK